MKKLFLIAILIGTASITAQETRTQMTRYNCSNPHPQDVINSKNAVALNGGVDDYNGQFAASQAVNFKTNNLASIPGISDFKLATVSLMGTDSQFLTRFNPISNEIEIKSKDDNKAYNLVKLEGAVVNFNSSDESYKAVSYTNERGETVLDYFMVSSKNPNLLIKNEMTYKKAKVATTSYDVSKPASYKQSKNYFYVDFKNELVAFSAKRKTIKKHFKSYEKEILAFVKGNNINSNEKDLAQLVGFIKNLEITKNINGALASSK